VDMAGRVRGGQVMPPWLWLWLVGDLAVLVPAEVSYGSYLITLLTGHGDISPQVTSGTSYKLLLLFTIVAGLTCGALAVGVIATMFPRLRGRWVERRYPDADWDALDASAGGGAAGDWPALVRSRLAQMQEFVDQHDPSIRLRAVAGDDQLAGVYPGGWRSARIAVFTPLFPLWDQDRAAAQAILLHEVAVRRHGDQFVVGLGSPLVRLLRIWVPVFILLTVAPLIIYVALGSGLLSQAVSGRGAQLLLQPAALLILPVAALWLAELNADQVTARILGAEALGDALAVSRESRLTRPLRLLSRPPRRLRLRYAAPRRAGTFTVLAAWPVALIAQLLVIITGALIAYLLVSQSPHDIGTNVLAGTHEFLGSDRILIIAAIVLLLCWPVLARPWGRLWSAAPDPDPDPDRRQAWRPYLAAAAVPVALLVLSVAPLPAAYAAPAVSLADCSRLAAWQAGPGYADKVGAETDIEKLMEARDPADGQSDFNQLIAITAAALHNPPPGTARGGFIVAMSDFRAAGLRLGSDQVTAALAAIQSGITADQKATALLTSQEKKCRAS
jgi:Zn-dependent protease with chaperone function